MLLSLRGVGSTFMITKITLKHFFMRQLIYLYCLTYLTKWRNCISILALLLFSYSLMGQGWQRTYETLGFENARAEHIVATLDGGYCLTATVEIPSAQSIAVLKLDAEGNQQWIKYFGGILEDRSRRIF